MEQDTKSLNASITFALDRLSSVCDDIDSFELRSRALYQLADIVKRAGYINDLVIKDQEGAESGDSS